MRILRIRLTANSSSFVCSHAESAAQRHLQIYLLTEHATLVNILAARFGIMQDASLNHDAYVTAQAALYKIIISQKSPRPKCYLPQQYTFTKKIFDVVKCSLNRKSL